MHFIKQHIHHILDSYAGDVPLSHFLKAYFKNHSRLGSRDRKAITEALYGYYRLSRLFPDIPSDDLIRHGLNAGLIRHPFLNRVFDSVPKTNTLPGQVAMHEEPDITDELGTDLDINTAIGQYQTPFTLSKGLGKKAWVEMLMEQRALFARIRKNEIAIKALLEAAKIPFVAVSPSPSSKALTESAESRQVMLNGRSTDAALPGQQVCLVLENSLPLDKHLAPEDFVIQDYAVQTAVLKTALYCRETFAEVARLEVWDACAGAGGKTLYWKDLFPEHRVLATDLRASILHNLRGRARCYGAKNIRTQTLDVSVAGSLSAQQSQVDLIICDVPCSGSGTWGRTPEQFHFANTGIIETLPELQYRIVSQTASRLRPGGLLAYITCSAFKAENEAVVEKLAATMPLRLIHDELIHYPDLKSDIIYLALFTTS